MKSPSSHCSTNREWQKKSTPSAAKVNPGTTVPASTKINVIKIPTFKEMLPADGQAVFSRLVAIQQVASRILCDATGLEVADHAGN